MPPKSINWFYANSLSLVLLGLFMATITGHALTGWHLNNTQLAEHGAPFLNLGSYLTSGDFISTVFENWESEFLQMLAYVVLTIKLRQWGSDESKPLDKPDPVDAEPERNIKANSPWPVHAGGWVLSLYRHSLSLALGLLFTISFILHALGSAAKAADEARQHGELEPTLLEHLCGAGFWFESFQNWQSEFLSIAVFVLLGIWLRQQGSPESKPVAEAHAKTGH